MNDNACKRLRTGMGNGQLKLGVQCCRLFKKDKDHAWNSAIFEPILRWALVAGDSSVASQAIKERFDARVQLTFDERHDGMSITWDLKNGVSYLKVSPYSFDMLGFMAAERLHALLPLIAVVTRLTSNGQITINLGDEGNLPGISFCSNKDDVFLIPDSSYLLNKGYKVQSEYFAKNALPWENRRERLFWRGSTTGVRAANTSVLDLPRVAACLLAKEKPNLFDFAITGCVQLSPNDEELLRRTIEIKDFVKWQQLSEFKFHLDIDGNTNSWSGLILKLHSGGLVFKVESPFRFRQWYYGRLEPFTNFVPIASDLSDLKVKYDYYATHEDEARQIAARGKELALSIDYDNEVIMTSKQLIEQVKR